MYSQFLENSKNNPSFQGTPYEAGLAASHASERAKRRKSLTKLSMTELRVDDSHPFLPKSPTPPSPTERILA